MSDWLAAAAQTLGTIFTASLVHRLEPLSLLLKILVWDGADEAVAAAVLVGPDRHRARLSDLAGGNVATAWQGPQNGTGDLWRA